MKNIRNHGENPFQAGNHILEFKREPPARRPWDGYTLNTMQAVIVASSVGNIALAIHDAKYSLMIPWLIIMSYAVPLAWPKPRK